MICGILYVYFSLEASQPWLAGFFLAAGFFAPATAFCRALLLVGDLGGAGFVQKMPRRNIGASGLSVHFLPTEKGTCGSSSTHLVPFFMGSLRRLVYFSWLTAGAD